MIRNKDGGSGTSWNEQNTMKSAKGIAQFRISDFEFRIFAAPCSALHAPCSRASIARFAIHTITNEKMTASIVVYAHGCTVPKANGVARIRKIRPAVKRRSSQ